MFAFVSLIVMFKNLTNFIWYEFNSLPYILYSGSFPLTTNSIILLMYKFQHNLSSSLYIKIVKILISPASISSNESSPIVIDSAYEETSRKMMSSTVFWKVFSKDTACPCSILIKL